MTRRPQAQKFSNVSQQGEEGEDLPEDSVRLESPLDKIEPYQAFRNALLSTSRRTTPYHVEC